MYNKDGWSIDAECIEFLIANLPKGSTILELGSGEGTAELAKHFNMISIEHNAKYVGMYDSTYIHAPLVGKWYNVEVLAEELPKHKYDAILIDGPPGIFEDSRHGFYRNLDLFNTDAMLVFDDMQRKGDKLNFKMVAMVFYPPRKYSLINKNTTVIHAKIK